MFTDAALKRFLYRKEHKAPLEEMILDMRDEKHLLREAHGGLESYIRERFDLTSGKATTCAVQELIDSLEEYKMNMQNLSVLTTADELEKMLSDFIAPEVKRRFGVEMELPKIQAYGTRLFRDARSRAKAHGWKGLLDPLLFFYDDWDHAKKTQGFVVQGENRINICLPREESTVYSTLAHEYAHLLHHRYLRHRHPDIHPDDERREATKRNQDYQGMAEFVQRVKVTERFWNKQHCLEEGIAEHVASEISRTRGGYCAARQRMQHIDFLMEAYRNLCTALDVRPAFACEKLDHPERYWLGYSAIALLAQRDEGIVGKLLRWEKIELADV